MVRGTTRALGEMGSMMKGITKASSEIGFVISALTKVGSLARGLIGALIGAKATIREATLGEANVAFSKKDVEEKD